MSGGWNVWRWFQLDMRDRIGSGEFQKLLWGLLKGEHIDIDSEDYTYLEEGFTDFQNSFRSLGFNLKHELGSGFFYLQRIKVADSTEKRHANQISTLFFITVQVLQDKETSKIVIDLPYLLNNNGFPLEHLLSKRTLPNHLSRIFNGIGIKSDEDMISVLTRMQSMKLVEKISDNGIWRFRRGIARLEQLARSYAEETRGEEE